MVIPKFTKIYNSEVIPRTQFHLHRTSVMEGKISDFEIRFSILKFLPDIFDLQQHLQYFIMSETSQKEASIQVLESRFQYRNFEKNVSQEFGKISSLSLNLTRILHNCFFFHLFHHLLLLYFIFLVSAIHISWIDSINQNNVIFLIRPFFDLCKN